MKYVSHAGTGLIGSLVFVNRLPGKWDVGLVIRSYWMSHPYLGKISVFDYVCGQTSEVRTSFIDDMSRIE